MGQTEQLYDLSSACKLTCSFSVRPGVTWPGRVVVDLTPSQDRPSRWGEKGDCATCACLIVLLAFTDHRGLVKRPRTDNTFMQLTSARLISVCPLHLGPFPSDPRNI